MTPEEKIRDFKKKYGVRIKETIKRVTRIAGEKAMKDLIKRTKEGKGTDGKLKPLRAKTIAYRRKWSRFLANDTSPAKSNLTATGQMLDALFLRVVGDRFFIKVNSKNRGESLGGSAVTEIKKTSKAGKVSSVGYESKLTNDQVRKYTEDAGREFLKLSDSEKEELRQFVLEQFKLELRDLL
jgi:hypothetical protein